MCFIDIVYPSGVDGIVRTFLKARTSALNLNLPDNLVLTSQNFSMDSIRKSFNVPPTFLQMTFMVIQAKGHMQNISVPR